MQERKGMRATLVRWALAAFLAVTIIVPPVAYHRWTYSRSKRLRVVAPGKYYRSGLMTAAGLDEALRTYKIRTVVNLIDKEPDPALAKWCWSRELVSEKSICEKNGAKHLFIRLDLVNQRSRQQRPRAAAKLLAIFDNKENYPILVHCRAGLHRAGVVNAIYRIEYDNWSATRAWHELRENGFGEYTCYADNVYIWQYIFDYHPRRSASSPQAGVNGGRESDSQSTSNRRGRQSTSNRRARQSTSNRRARQSTSNRRARQSTSG